MIHLLDFQRDFAPKTAPHWLAQQREVLEAWLGKEEWVSATVRQLEKDLSGLTAAEPHFELDNKQDLLEQLSVQLAAIIRQMPLSALQQFLYSVDVSASEVQQALGAPNDRHLMAFYIIRREAQKVYLRKMPSTAFQ